MRIFGPGRVKIHSLPNPESLGRLLLDIGIPNIVRGNVNGQAGIDWIPLKSQEQIDREITLLGGEGLELLTLSSIINGVPNVKHPVVEECHGDRVFKLQSARYDPTEKKIRVSCTSMENSDCIPEEIPVEELRKLLCPGK